MLADKGYDSDDVRASLLLKGILPVIPPKANRREAIACDFRAYKDRNRVERMFNRLKQFRRIATRYDKTAVSFLGFLALAANVASVLLLMSYKDGDANVRSVWLCSRNDAIGNVIVMIAAIGVWGTATAWPDLIVAAIMAGLFLSSSVQILSQSYAEWKRGEPPLELASAKTAIIRSTSSGCTASNQPEPKDFSRA